MTPRVVLATQAGRRLFTDVDPMDMWESNGVTPADIAAVEAEARQRTCIHPCRECADPLDVTPDPCIAPFGEHLGYPLLCTRDRGHVGRHAWLSGGVWEPETAAVSGWMGGLPLVIAAVILGIVIGKVWL